ncbi:MAG: amidohydrolase [Candidatus Hydrogenedentota bacterium]|nr:MAG: amidohydrolase [Candidatus Hydrogenedentota bacterium]
MKFSRRNFLRTTAALTLGAGQVSGKSAALSVEKKNNDLNNPLHDLMERARSYKKIDAHGHLVTPSPVDFIRALDRVGIERSTISIPLGQSPTEFRSSNDLVLAAIKEFPNRLLGQCYVNPLYEKESLEEAKRCLGEGMIGLGELYTQVKINDPIYASLIELCIKERASILVHIRADLGLIRPGHPCDAPHSTSTTEDIVNITRQYPEAIFIHGHVGGGGDWELMCKILRDAPKVYLDTSGSVSDAGMIDYAVKQIGIERLLFATDINLETGIGKIMSADLSEKDRELIFWKNFQSILDIRGIQ